MFLTFYLLFIGLHVSAGCIVVKNEKALYIKAHTGGSVLLPCYCTDLQTKPDTLTWKKLNGSRNTWEDISSESGQYRNRVQLSQSSGNLSLLISNLTEEDRGTYRCDGKGSEHTDMILTIEGVSNKTTKSTAFVNSPTTTTTSITVTSQTSNGKHSTQSPAEDKDAERPIYFFIPILVILLLGLGGVIYWKYREQRRGQMWSKEQRGSKREQETQDQVTYSTVLHSNTTTTPTVSDTGDNTEYATIKVN